MEIPIQEKSQRGSTSEVGEAPFGASPAADSIRLEKELVIELDSSPSPAVATSAPSTPRSILKRQRNSTTDFGSAIPLSFLNQNKPQPSRASNLETGALRQDEKEELNPGVVSGNSISANNGEEAEPPPTPPKSKVEKARALAKRKLQVSAWKRIKEREERLERIAKRQQGNKTASAGTTTDDNATCGHDLGSDGLLRRSYSSRVRWGRVESDGDLDSEISANSSVVEDADNPENNGESR